MLKEKINDSLTILHLSSEKSWRGGEQQIAYLIHELNAKGVTNIVACREHSAFEAYCQKQQWKYYSMPFKGSLDISSILSIKKISKAEKVDLIHMHSAKSHTLAVLSHLLGNRAPLILSRRVDFPIKKKLFTLWKYNHAAIKKVVCVSHTIEQIVRRSIRFPDKCTTVYSGIDTGKFSRERSSYLRTTFQIPSNTYLVGNTSALGGHKDYFTFVDTAVAFRKTHIPAHFFIIGDGPEKEKIKNYIEQHNASSYITMTGFMDNIPEILPELDVFLITSETEGLGTSVLDAFACRVPVVATDGGGIPEMVKHQKTGMLAKVKDAQTLAQHLEKVLTQPSLQEVLTEEAYLCLQANFTKEKMAQGILRVYHDVLSKTP